jgi:flagellar hook-associated protein 2
LKLEGTDMTSIAATLGIGSGIDTAKLVADLAAASREPKVAALERRSSDARARISALAQARSDLESFASSFATLVAGGTLQTQPTASDPWVIGAVAQPGARVGTLAAEIEVTQLAKAQTVYSAYLPTATEAIGQGGMTLSVGGTDYAVTIDVTNDSLSGLATAINASNSDVMATLMTDASGARLVLKGPVGATGAFTLSNAGGAPGLDRFTYPPATGGMALAQSAQDAQFSIDGIGYTRASNSVSDIFPGITLSLKQAAPGKIIAVTSARPTETIKQTLQDFVSVFNTMKKDIAAARSANRGDAGLRSLEQQLSALIGQAVTSDAAINSLSDIGIATTRDGTISLNMAKLEDALRTNPDAVEALLSPTRDATRTAITDPGLSGALNALKEKATTDGGAIDSLKKRLDRETGQIEKDRERMEAREASYRDRLTRQFSGMDARVAVLKATQSYLEQQVALWTKSS